MALESQLEIPNLLKIIKSVQDHYERRAWMFINA
jgi:hypothetical protein